MHQNDLIVINGIVGLKKSAYFFGDVSMAGMSSYRKPIFARIRRLYICPGLTMLLVAKTALGIYIGRRSKVRRRV